MKRAKKDPWRVVRREFARYFYGDGKTPWTFVEGKDVFMAHNIYAAVVSLDGCLSRTRHAVGTETPGAVSRILRR